MEHILKFCIKESLDAYALGEYNYTCNELSIGDIPSNLVINHEEFASKQLILKKLDDTNQWVALTNTKDRPFFLNDKMINSFAPIKPYDNIKLGSTIIHILGLQ